LVEKLALPLESKETVPRVTVPSWKVKVPVGVPAAEVTVVVKVTWLPKVEGLGEDEGGVVTVLAWLTVCVTAGEELAAKLVLPL
jgi:hypothetical protein